MHLNSSQTRLCRSCGKDWYSAKFLSGDEVRCPECDLPLTQRLDATSQEVAIQLTRIASRRPGTREQARFN